MYNLIYLIFTYLAPFDMYAINANNYMFLWIVIDFCDLVLNWHYDYLLFCLAIL